MSDQQARSLLVEHFTFPGWSAEDARIGVDLAFQSMDEAIATHMRVCKTGSPRQRRVAFLIAPQLLAGTFSRISADLCERAIQAGDVPLKVKINVALPHG